MTVSAARGTEADDLLRDDRFRAEWRHLAEDCPWATAFQGPDFGYAWYLSYRKRYEPLLVMERTGDGTLAGLLPLAIGCADPRELVLAGAWQAEYHAWISAPGIGDRFPAHAMQWLRGAFPSSVLTFRYLPPGTPLGWLADRALAPAHELTAFPRPLLRIGPRPEAENFLKNKTTRNQLNRLTKLGPVAFQRLTGAEQLDVILDQLIRFYDFRQAAVHGVEPFRTDPAKRPFHLRMMATPGLLHATVLTVGDRMIAAHLGIASTREVHLGILGHDPFLAKCSPGKFLIHFLAGQMQAEGYEQMDLTPGGDPYKDRFADHHDEVMVLTLFPGSATRERHVARRRLARAGRRLLEAVHVKPERAKALGAQLSRAGPRRVATSLARRARTWLDRTRELRIYTHNAVHVAEVAEDCSIRRDALDDLLAFVPGADAISDRSFFAEALARIEAGQHVYTHVADGRLVHWGWLAERQETSFLSEVNTPFTFPPNSACLFDYYTDPHYRGRGLYARSLRKMLKDAARVPGTEKVYIFVLADNTASRHVIEKSGFHYEGSIFEAIRFGRSRHWTQMVMEGPVGGCNPAPRPQESQSAPPSEIPARRRGS